MKSIPLLKSKQGVSLESAVLFMLIIFTFCFLISTLAVCGHYQVKIDGLKARHNIQTEQIGEDFVAYLHEAGNAGAPEDFEAYLTANNLTYENYSCRETKTQDADTTVYELTVKRGSDESADAVLYVKAQRTQEGQVTVLAWLPTPESAEQ